MAADVVALGAKGDGEADDTAAVQKAVDAGNFDEGPEVIATKSLEYLKRTFGA